MPNLYLLKEDGGKISLEDLSGAIILEASSIPGPTVDWQAGGRGRPYKARRNETEELFDSIEHALEVALGIAEEPLEVSAGAVVEEATQPAWSESRYREALDQLERVSRSGDEVHTRLQRLRAMLRAYEEAQARERAIQDDEEIWLLMS